MSSKEDVLLIFGRASSFSEMFRRKHGVDVFMKPTVDKTMDSLSQLVRDYESMTSDQKEALYLLVGTIHTCLLDSHVKDSLRSMTEDQRDVILYMIYMVAFR